MKKEIRVYSPLISDKRLHAARRAGLPYRKLPREKSIEISASLEILRSDGNGGLLPPGQLQRSLKPSESEFIESERLISKADFSYYLSRYHSVERDPGVDRGEGIGPTAPLESQVQFIRLLGKREEEVHAEFAKHKHTEGIRILAHKCRQVLFTSTSRALTLHRMIFWPGTRAFAGTLDPDGCGELYKRDTLSLSRLPWWLHPGELYPDVKNTEIGFPAPINSRLLYQPENQKTGIGVGTQQDVSHLTEVALWNYPHQIGFSFAPSLPKSRMTLHIQESTSYGKGYWYEVTEACRRREKGYESWIYIFVPWWFNRNKYRSICPDSWHPSDHTVKHAELIERTSPEWNNGITVHPTRGQLFWWESERAKYAREGKLASFLNSYPATPDQSFTNWNEGALPAELIEEMELDLRIPKPYEAQVSA